MYDRRWRRARAAFLVRHPLCVECERLGIVTAAGVVDHVVPHRGDGDLFWDEGNWRAVCKHHHDTGTARFDGGFGNPAKAKVDDRGCDASGFPSGADHPWNET